MAEFEDLLADVIRYHEEHGQFPPAVAADLLAAAETYLEIATALDSGSMKAPRPAASSGPETLPVIDGFRTIERIGSGGMGHVYKLQDLKLDRVVAAKIVRRDAGGPAGDFLREAKSLALFSDPRIVRIFEYRTDRDPAVIIMEFVDGF